MPLVESLKFHTTMIINGSLSLLICAAWLLIELAFALICYSWIIPKANRIVDAAPYRDYGHDRHKLLLRILQRIERTCCVTNENVQQTILNTLHAWFHTSLNPVFVDGEQSKLAVDELDVLKAFSQNLPSRSPPSSSPESSDEDDDEKNQSPRPSIVGDKRMEPAGCLFKEDMDIFLSWAFFGKELSTLANWEQQELQRLYEMLEQRHKISFPSQLTTPSHDMLYQCKPRVMSLEPVKAIHRPLLVYVFVLLVKLMGGIVLHFYGYRRFVAATGLVIWHKPAIKGSQHSLLPMLFFHGIAPTGLILYLPMLLGVLATEPDRPIFFIENHSISCTLDLRPLTEEETVDGVVEILTRFGLQDADISLVGHSFGSCPITWLLASQRLPNVRQVVLLDPVAILLSEHDVMVNFLYAEELDKIRMLASSELFTEYYLRRHFAWYNSELWLDSHIDKYRCQLLICLAEQDEIINAPKVRREILQHSVGQLVYWQNVGHGDCITSPAKWKQIKSIMLEQELKIVQEMRTQ